MFDLEKNTAHPFPKYPMARTPAGRWGKPEALAGSAVLLSSGASNFVYDQILYVGGGIQDYFAKQPGISWSCHHFA